MITLGWAGPTTAGLSISERALPRGRGVSALTDAKIGTTTDADPITLADDAVAVAGTLDCGRRLEAV